MYRFRCQRYPSVSIIAIVAARIAFANNMSSTPIAANAFSSSSRQQAVVTATSSVVGNVKAPPFDETVLSYDHYNGVTLHLGDYMKWIQQYTSEEEEAAAAAASKPTTPDNNDTTGKFASDLETALEFWRAEGRKGIWVHAPPEAAQYIPSCVQAGFNFQQIKRGNTSTNETTYSDDNDDDKNNVGKKETTTETIQHDMADNTLIMSQWLPDTPSKLPLGPTHQCGVGVVVLNPRDPSQMLVVQEKSGPAAAFNLWKMPTGLSDPSEDIHEAAVRELLEETGLHATFDGVVCFRQAHRPGGATSDLFFVCHMKLDDQKNSFTDDKENEVIWKPQEDEIADIKWMSVQDFCAQDRWQGSPLYTSLNNLILKLSESVASSVREPADSSPSLPLIEHQQLDVGFGRTFGGTNALFLPPSTPEPHVAAKNIPQAASTLSPTAVTGMIDFLTMARGLKTIPRTGWVRQGAGPKIESVADHSWRISLMSMVSSSVLSSSSSSSSEDSPQPMYDTNRCIKMALVHDLAEAVVGDITPHCGVTDQDKHSQELAAITEMTRKLCLGTSTESGTTDVSPQNTQLVGEEILELWKEYEEGITPESNLVKDMDKLEMTLQALEYENDGKNEKSLDGFFDSTRNKWRTEIGKSWGEEIESRRRRK
mmetsp:Transcript_35483/g.85862  ORF Transcript_35483/g.85862 Transcript_35483/m.85862 type:complete len:652 (+) Transcript_35483:140-2095(+)